LHQRVGTLRQPLFKPQEALFVGVDSSKNNPSCFSALSSRVGATWPAAAATTALQPLQKILLCTVCKILEKVVSEGSCLGPVTISRGNADVMALHDMIGNSGFWVYADAFGDEAKSLGS